MRASSRLRMLVLALSVLSWLSAQGGSRVHRMVEEHEVCEHGELVEVEAAPLPFESPGDPEGEHPHGCTYDGLAVAAVQGDAVFVPTTAPGPVAAPETVAVAPPRAPPLGFAPKTSPPTA